MPHPGELILTGEDADRANAPLCQIGAPAIVSDVTVVEKRASAADHDQPPKRPERDPRENLPG
jgi:hypothetical protein